MTLHLISWGILSLSTENNKLLLPPKKAAGRAKIERGLQRYPSFDCGGKFDGGFASALTSLTSADDADMGEGELCIFYFFFWKKIPSLVIKK